MADNATYLAEYNGGALVGTAVSFLVLTFLSVGLRTYVRGVLTNSFMADDWLMLGAQVWPESRGGAFHEVTLLADHAGRPSSPYRAHSFCSASMQGWGGTIRQCRRTRKYKR